MLFSLPSFTAPETEVLQSFSGLDPRLKECLGISGYLQKSSMQEFAGRGCILRTFQHAVLKHIVKLNTLKQKYYSVATPFLHKVPPSLAKNTKRMRKKTVREQKE